VADLEKTFPQESGLTLYCFPDQRYDDVSLDDWDDLAVDANEQAAPDLGRYDVTLDDTYRYWMVFEGATQPTDWDQWIDVIDIYDGQITAENLSTSAIAKINQSRR
jgi:hypothetical protein